MKKVIVISTSLRHGSNSDMLADQFVEGAKAAGNQVEKISLVGKNIQFCKGCLGCQKLGRCVINDDVNGIMAKVLNADVVCWATPIYYYEMSGQMKTLIDRMNAMYEQDYQFRDVYLLTTAAEDEEQTPKRAETGLTGWIDCYPESRLAGTLFCGGVNDAREIEAFSPPPYKFVFLENNATLPLAQCLCGFARWHYSGISGIILTISGVFSIDIGCQRLHVGA